MMKYLVVFALIAAVASARHIRTMASDEVQQAIAAINSPSTDPATAVLLEQLLLEALGISPVAVGPAIVDAISPIAVGPAIVDSISPVVVDSPSPISVGPAIVDSISPIAVGPAIVDTISPIAVGPAFIDFELPEGALGETVNPAPAVVAPTPVAAAESSPLVQIIVNVIGGPTDGPNPVAVVGPEAAAAVEAEAVVAPTPVNVIEEAFVQPEPVAVVDQPLIIPQPVVLPESILPEVVAPEPVIIIEAPAPSPISVAEPVLPVPVSPVVLPETLN